MNLGVQEDYIKKAKEIFKLINDFRRNPKILSKHLENLRRYLDKSSNVLSEPGKIQVQMVEGELVFNEAIDFLNTLPLLKPLEWDDNLSLSAMEHVLDIGPKGLLSYQSSDGTEPEERISRYGNYIDSLGENIDFGPNDAMGVIVSLTLDDGEADRPHRDNLFKADYQKIGIACGPHKTEYQMCVMDFAFDFIPFGDETEIEVTQSGTISNSKNMNNLNNAKSDYQYPPNGNKNESVSRNNTNSNVKNNISSPVPVKPNYDMFVDPSSTANFNHNNDIGIGIGANNNVNKQSFKYEDTFKPSGNNNMTAPNTNTKVPSPYANSNQSPLVRLSLDREESNIKSMNIKNNMESAQIAGEDEALVNRVKLINLEKKVVSKLVEVTTRIVYTYEDGSTKEVVEKQNHNFHL